MQQHGSQQITLPYLKTTDHLLPSTQRRIHGSGLMFTNIIREATRSGGVWLVMQDSDGQSAMSEGDIVSQAKIQSVDWLSCSQICVDLHITGWGMVETSNQTIKPGQLNARLRPLWATKQQCPADDILVIRLKQWQREYACQPGGDHDDPAGAFDSCWLCWRWLELLPLPLVTKQRLLKQSDPRACLRYLKKMILQSDLYAGMLR